MHLWQSGNTSVTIVQMKMIATPEERREELMKLNLEELIKETDTDDTYYPLDTYMEHFL